MDINKAVSDGIEITINDFQTYPHNYFTEEDVRWRLLREIENNLAKDGSERIPFSGGLTSAIHTEYPTPFRCSMNNRRFRLLDFGNKKGYRGHFDIAILNASAASQCEFEILRSQYYKRFCERLKSGAVPLPLLDYAIELKLYRDLNHPNRTESAKQQAEYAVQAVEKLAATVKPNDYYPEAFAKYGIVLLFDNSDIVTSSNIEVARSKFLEGFSELADWDSYPNRLSCIWVTTRDREDYTGRKR